MLDLLAPLYKEIMRLRNSSYDKRIFEVHDLGARTISVGNVTTGGTGKTPLVALIAKHLLDKGETVCILTRGYGRANAKTRVLVSDGDKVLSDAVSAGDEPFELAKKFNGRAIIIADADRVSAGEWAKRKFGVTTFLLDDGFQHRKVKRDLDIVCIDATQPFFDAKSLPAGRLREPIDAIRRADAIVITRADQAENFDEFRDRLISFAEGKQVFAANAEIVRFAPPKGDDTFDISQPCFAFCGLGNPTAFFTQLRAGGVQLAGETQFRDHHIYTQSDVDSVVSLAKQSRAKFLLTTAKDAVKLVDLEFELPCFAAEIEMRIDDDNAFREIILSKTRR